jgi:hypothetical protein
VKDTELEANLKATKFLGYLSKNEKEVNKADTGEEWKGWDK